MSEKKKTKLNVSLAPSRGQTTNQNLSMSILSGDFPTKLCNDIFFLYFCIILYFFVLFLPLSARPLFKTENVFVVESGVTSFFFFFYRNAISLTMLCYRRYKFPNILHKLY